MSKWIGKLLFLVVITSALWGGTKTASAAFGGVCSGGGCEECCFDQWSSCDDDCDFACEPGHGVDHRECFRKCERACQDQYGRCLAGCPR